MKAQGARFRVRRIRPLVLHEDHKVDWNPSPCHAEVDSAATGTTLAPVAASFRPYLREGSQIPESALPGLNGEVQNYAACVSAWNG
jgi:hypothetical protein